MFFDISSANTSGQQSILLHSLHIGTEGNITQFREKSTRHLSAKCAEKWVHITGTLAYTATQQDARRMSALFSATIGECLFNWRLYDTLV
jgi:hypothetical protein